MHGQKRKTNSQMDQRDCWTLKLIQCSDQKIGDEKWINEMVGLFTTGGGGSSRDRGEEWFGRARRPQMGGSDRGEADPYRDRRPTPSPQRAEVDRRRSHRPRNRSAPSHLSL